jgi:hypothetical protein
MRVAPLPLAEPRLGNGPARQHPPAPDRLPGRDSEWWRGPHLPNNVTRPRPPLRLGGFMNRFRKLGFIDYDCSLEVRSSLLNIVLHDEESQALRTQAGSKGTSQASDQAQLFRTKPYTRQLAKLRKFRHQCNSGRYLISDGIAEILARRKYRPPGR